MTIVIAAHDYFISIVSESKLVVADNPVRSRGF
jgi:hypothetical protein